MRPLAAGAGIGAVLGVLLAALVGGPPLVRRATLELPLPYQSPPFPGGASLRLAMVHDVLHERYPVHGPAWYESRNRLVRAALETEPEGTPAREALLDDLGAGLDRLGRHDEAADVLRAKLAAQEAAGASGARLYSTCANLGTFLVHGSLHGARRGDPAAAARLEEGLGFLRRAIELDPGSHFGRETWQVVAAEFLVAAARDPALLLSFDLVGNLLEAAPEWRDGSTRRDWRASTPDFDVAVAAGLAPPPEREARFIRRVGAEGDWADRVPSRHAEPVPFDEPILGLVGMWRLGGGPNPHFALALAGIAERIGQRRIAWDAYARAIEMRAGFSLDPSIGDRLGDHCRRRQEVLAASMGGEDCASRHAAELAHGRSYQAAYQAYEAERLAAGASIEDPDFHADFLAAHGRIATAPGRADWIEVEPRPSRALAAIPAAVFLAGLGALIASFASRTG